jgi:demethylmenaquinone methyltransferase/2-methoxy-6-polyprenyl-1,4-benzoquinol methylase
MMLIVINLDMLNTAGFANSDFHNMTGGVVALHRGVKP